MTYTQKKHKHIFYRFIIVIYIQVSGSAIAAVLESKIVFYWFVHDWLYIIIPLIYHE